ncbi:unnamed protein product [Acanthoscelides obtectus]|uniref:Uncharacterized protein n=1 Tax=Acanthoscelides obtectus TaxID=200917 RepID=A0A9P0JZV0_ACAOB|nr:unnamed protein product [Acanthoscelides obtectus]CAK1647896.1 hypothetical protein AOBTE_LOCUS15445 [Acanthoscelides obtectus]
MHTFWLRLREPPGGTSAFDSQRPSTTYELVPRKEGKKTATRRCRVCSQTKAETKKRNTCVQNATLGYG